MKNNKLSRRLKREWIKALRSGKYKQCHHMLHKDNSFCCLGVLADINEDAYWIPNAGFDVGQWILINEKGRRYDQTYGGSLFGNNIAAKLASMNDYGKNFSEIADWIEENL